MVLRLLAGVLLIGVLATAGRYKLNIDPETKEGYVLQQIRQERDPAKKIALLVQFLDEFPKDENLPWVLEQLIPHYTDEKAWAKARAAAERMLAVRPTDIDAAETLLTSAQQLKEPGESVRNVARIAWKAADDHLRAPKPEDQAAVAAWKESMAWANRLKQSAEYAIYALAKEPGTQKQALGWLEELNPTSLYLISSTGEFAVIYQQQGNTAKMLTAVKEALAKEPDNTDYLATLAEHAMKQNDFAQVVSYSGRLIDVLTGPRPDGISESDWAVKKSRYLASAYWLNAVTSMSRGNLHQADKSFRAALPFFRGNRDYLSAGLYNLGYINYKLADKGEPGRVMEALKYSKQCVEFGGPHAPSAQQNIAAIKAAYNIQ